MFHTGDTSQARQVRICLHFTFDSSSAKRAAPHSDSSGETAVSERMSLAAASCGELTAAGPYRACVG